MARYDREGVGPTYAAAQRFVDACLRDDGSLFTHGLAVWTIGHFEELDRDYVQAPDPGTGTFFEKLHGQIGGSSQGAIQLAAELLYVLYLPASGSIGGDKKREHIRQVLSWMAAPPPIPDDLAAALDQGIGGGGTGFNTYRWAHFSYLVRFGLAWKRLAPTDRADALADPWRFHAAAGAVEVESGTFAHEALLHLVHSDTFERIFSRGDKWTLTQRLAGLAGDDPDVDRRISQIRTRLEPRFGAGFDFYNTIGVTALWRPEDDRWRVFLYWCRRFREDASFDEAERDYKLELAQLLTASRRALLDAQDDWLDLLGRALKSRHNNLTDWRQHDTFLKWAAADQETARVALSALWREGADPVEALEAFLGQVPRTAISTPGNRTSIGSVLLMAVDATRCPPYRPTPLQRAYALTGSDDEENDEVARYRRALGFFDTVLKRGPEVGLELRDRLDAQAVTWWLTSGDPPPAEWTQEDKDALGRFRGTTETSPADVGPVLTDEDFAVLARHHDSKGWNAIPADDQAALRGLRGRLDELATIIAERLSGRVALQGFTSILNPSGRAPKYYWICAFPKVSRNKSYAYQMLLIVHPEWVELGFANGSGDSQLQDAALEVELRGEMTLAKASLAAAKGAPWTAELERHVRELGYEFRRRWTEPETAPLAGIGPWLDASGEPGATVSQFLSPEEVVSLGPGLADRVLGLLEPLVPLLEAAHADQPVNPPPPADEPVTIAQLAKTLYLDADYLRDVEWLLRDKRQLVFYGPPGTGKTFVAEAFAEWFAGDPSRVDTVQFHPSYAYEDFIEGIRPALDADRVRYTLGEGGLLKRFANRAAKDPEHRPHVLVIDEINRANLARVFGELLYLLEYRKREVTLPYSGERFRLPDNLYLIGTMNTADRSIALVDFALRRRFHFIRFDPDVAVLRRWLVHHEVSTEPADLLAWVNHEIGDGDFAIGFSHFMRDDLDETILRRVWERSIMPALEEFYFDDTEKRARFALDRVRAALRGIPSTAEVGQGSAEDGEEDAPG